MVAQCLRVLMISSRAALLAGLMMAGPAMADFLPVMEGETLDKTERVYPRDFQGKPTMMVILFDRDQQSQLDGWAAAIDELPEGIGMVEIALIGKVGGMARFFIKGGMRDAMSDDKQRQARMMPYFGDADLVKDRLKITDVSQVIAYLLSPDGEVLWQEAGSYDGQFGRLPAISQ